MREYVERLGALWVDEEGATVVEYAAIVGLVALALFPVMKWLALKLLVWAISVALAFFWGF